MFISVGHNVQTVTHQNRSTTPKIELNRHYESGGCRAMPMFKPNALDRDHLLRMETGRCKATPLLNRST